MGAAEAASQVSGRPLRGVTAMGYGMLAGPEEEAL